MPRTSAAKTAKASDNPVIRSKTIDATQEQVGRDSERLMRADGPAETSLSPEDKSQQHDRLFGTGAIDLSGITRDMTYTERKEYKRAHDPEYLANLKFFDEMVEIYIHTTTNPQDAKLFPVRDMVFERGKTYTVKRWMVEILARCKKTGFTQKEGVGADGEKVMRQIPSTSLAFPFNVTRDDNPKGADWLRWTLAQP